MKQSAQRHHEGEWSCTLDHSLFQKSRTKFSSLERFKLADKSQSDPTGEIVITYDFLSKNPFAPDEAKILPERYKIVVQVTQEPYLSMLSESDSRPSFITRLLKFPSITVSVEYVDYTVARALIGGVKEWVEGLTTTKQSNISKLFMRNEMSIHQIVPSILAACVLLGAAGVMRHNASISWSFVFSCLSLSVLSFGLGTLISDSFMSNLHTLQAPTTILITRGDRTHQENALKKRSRAKGFIVFLMGAVVLSILVNVFSSFIYQWIVDAYGATAK